ncbi:MAG: ferritin [Bacteroidales bacterium]
MINKKIEKVINEQINAELWSAYLYLSMSAWFEGRNLPGFANWMRIQWQEETAHAMKFFDYLNERGGTVKLAPIAEVQTEWKDAVEIFAETLKHERVVTSLIHKIVDVAIEEKDHATNNMIQWFVAEQVEEEAAAEQILEQVKMVGDHGHALLMLDRVLGERVFVDPTQE